MAGNEKENKKAMKPKKQKQKGRVKKFFKEFIGEMKKLNWLTPKDLIATSLAVLAFVAIFAVIIGVLDTAFGEGFRLLSSIK